MVYPNSIKATWAVQYLTVSTKKQIKYLSFKITQKLFHGYRISRKYFHPPCKFWNNSKCYYILFHQIQKETLIFITPHTTFPCKHPSSYILKKIHWYSLIQLTGSKQNKQNVYNIPTYFKINQHIGHSFLTQAKSCQKNQEPHTKQ